MGRGGLSVRWRKGVLWLMIGGVVLGGVPANAEDALEVSAASAVMMQADSGRILYQEDAHTPRAMASTTKIMTALLAAERLPLDRDVSVSAQAVRVEGTALGLRGGDAISVRDLITGLLLASGNDAANVLAQEVAGSQEAFAVLMNQRATEIGMKHTHFVTPSGLDAEGHASTAYDMALLAREALKNGTIAAIAAKVLDNKLGVAHTRGDHRQPQPPVAAVSGRDRDENRFHQKGRAMSGIGCQTRWRDLDRGHAALSQRLG